MDTIVEHYLREHRGLDLPAELAGESFAFTARSFLDQQTRLPGMVCLMRDIETNEPCGIHRTFLDGETGNKVDRKMLGTAEGAAIKFNLEPNNTLTIGEGVETVLSAREAWPFTGMGTRLERHGREPVLKQLSELTILEENDPTSRRDVKRCTRRYLDARRPVNIVTSHVGNDFNDAWRAMK